MNLDKADKACSEYNRRKNTDERGYVKCVTCSISVHWKSLDCGHYVPRGNLTTRFSEVNCHPQCRYCNQILSGNIDKYRNYLVDRYSEEEVIRLEQMGKQSVKMFQFDVDGIEQHYKNKIKELIT